MKPVFERFVPAEFQNIISYLEDWTEVQHIVPIAVDACRERIREYLVNNSHLASDSPIDIQFLQHSLIFEHRGLVCPHIRTELTLNIGQATGTGEPTSQTRKIIGTYSYSLRLDRAFVADFLNIFNNTEL